MSKTSLEETSYGSASDNATPSVKRYVQLPFPCFSLVALPAIHDYLPSRRSADQFDPRQVLLHYPGNVERLLIDRVALPRAMDGPESLARRGNKTVDALHAALAALQTAIGRYREAFTISRVDPATGAESTFERQSTSSRMIGYKAALRAVVQGAALSYQRRQLGELKHVLRRHVFQRTLPGCYAPALPDQSLQPDEVRLPAKIWSLFKGQDALVLRHPVLKSLYRLKPVKGSDWIIGLHPLLFPEIGLDADGDLLFATPVPRELDGGQAFFENHVDEGMLFDIGRPIHERGLPIAIPPLQLADLGPDSAFTQAVERPVDVDGEARRVRHYGRALYEPMTAAAYGSSSLEAAARFQFEKRSVARVDKVRRSLLALFSGQAPVLAAINLFCAEASQKAVDSGKHGGTFNLKGYMAAFEGLVRPYDGHGVHSPGFVFASGPAEIAQELCEITGSGHRQATGMIAAALFGLPDFLPLGLTGLVQVRCPWFALSQIKRRAKPSSPAALKEIALLLHGLKPEHTLESTLRGGNPCLD